jgi:hypothetical protein
MKDNDFKNAFPWETDERRDSDDERPRPLHTQADREDPLTREEADVLGISPTPETVYGEASGEPEEQKDQFAPVEDDVQ